MVRRVDFAAGSPAPSVYRAEVGLGRPAKSACREEARAAEGASDAVADVAAGGGLGASVEAVPASPGEVTGCEGFWYQPKYPATQTKAIKTPTAGRRILPFSFLRMSGDLSGITCRPRDTTPPGGLKSPALLRSGLDRSVQRALSSAGLEAVRLRRATPVLYMLRTARRASRRTRPAFLSTQVPQWSQ